MAAPGVTPDPRPLTLVAEAIADGHDIDWDGIEPLVAGPSLAALHGLRAVDGVARAYRTLDDGTPDAAAPEPPGASPVPSSWAHLQRLERVGSGASADVYRAWDPRLEREVALKLLTRLEPAADRSRAVQEGRLLARVRHPNVVSVFGADRVDGRVGVWMEFVHGQTLESRLTSEDRFGGHEIASIGRELCRALAAVHGAGLLHRDIKAQNVMRERGGRIVLMDFGGGREAQALPAQPGGDLAGTPLYLAPEVLDGGAATPRSEIHSLGVLLFHLATNSYPVNAQTLSGLLNAHRRGDRQRLLDLRPDLSRDLVRVIERASAPNPLERYASAGELEAALVAATEPGAVPLRRVPRRRVVVLAAAGLAGAFGLAWTTGAFALDPSPAIRSIAVVPFDDASAEGGGSAHTAAGLTEAITNGLARLPSLRVISYTSMMRARDRALSGVGLGERLGVTGVLEGAVSQSADRVTLNATLINAASLEVIWRQSFEVRRAEAASLQETAVRAIARAIGVEAPSGSAAGRQASVSFAAHDAYLRGRYQLNQRRGDTMLKSVGFFEEALGLEPRYAEAYVGLADAYVLLGSYGVLPMTDAYPKGRAAALKALEIDETLAEAHVPLAAVAAEFDWNWPQADFHFQRAIALNPNYAVARQWYADLLSGMLRNDEAIQQSTRAYELDPLSPMVQVSRAVKFYEARQYHRAVEEFRKILVVHPDFAPAHTHLGLVQVRMGAFDDAIRSLTEAQRLGHESSSDILALLGYAYAAAGRADDARAVLDRLRQIARTQPVKAFTIATIHAELGERDAAFAWLEQAIRDREWLLAYLKVLPTVDALRDDPRFEGLLVRLKLE